MKRKSSRFPSSRTAVSLIAAAFCAASLAVCAGSASANTYCVSTHRKKCLSTIGQAVSAASPGDTIRIFPGVYKEEVQITEPLTLIGSGKRGRATIIDASGLDHAIWVNGVTSGPVVIERVTAANANLEGILVQSSTDVTIADNTVAGNDKSLSGKTCDGALPFDQEDCGEGLHLLSSADSTVSRNVITGNAGGILLTDELGPTHDNLVSGNLVHDNTPDCGITMPSHPPCNPADLPGACVPEIGASSAGVYDNVVSQNVSEGNGAAGVGIFTPTPGTASYDNLVIGNLIRGNQQGGVVLHSHAVAQDLNGNAIIGNVISGNGGDTGSVASNPPPVGIVIFSDISGDAAPITGTRISENTISKEDVDVWVGTSATGLSLHLNDLLGGSSALGVEAVSPASADASNNYWGCATGPGTGNCTGTSGTVVTAPFLIKP